jgi:hypothetical protein
MAVDIGSSIGSALKQASSLTTNAVSKATSMFTGGLSEDIALVDSTAKSGIASLNTFKDNQVNALNGFIKKVSGGSLSISELSSFIDVRNGFKVDYMSLGKRLGEAAGFPINSVLNMSTQIQQEAMNLLDAYQSKNYLGMLNALGINIATDGSYEITSMLTDLINRYSDSDSEFSSVVDRTAQVAFLNVMLQYTVSSGLWEGIDTLLAQYTNKQDGLTALGNCASYAIANGDIYTLQAIVDRVGAPQVKALNANVVVDMLRNFRFRTGVTTSDYPNYRGRLAGVLDGLEPNWDKVNFGGVVANKLEPFTACSPDVTTLLQYEPRFRDQVLMAKLYGSQNVIDLLRSNYPNLAIVQ